MKKLVTAVVLALVAVPAFSVELTRASDDQLLGEVRRRMGGGGGGGFDQALASYTCDSSATLVIDLTSGQGTTQSKSYYVGNTQNCNSQSATLTASRSKIRNLSMIGVCDSSATLYRIPLRPDGQFGDVKSTYVGNTQSCLSQATAINQGN